jgi:SnoaL-like domain
MKQGRPESLSDIEWLVALEEIRQLKARRDRYVDAHDWEGYEALHAPDHVSHHASDATLGGQPPAWTSAAEMMSNIRKIMVEGMISVHHSYDPEIIFETPTRARGIWAMTAAMVSKNADGEPSWQISYGYYYETYEKRDGRWVFTTRRWQRYFGTGSDGVTFPTEPLKGSDAFSIFQA